MRQGIPRGRPSRPAQGPRDEGQLMLLAGIVLTIAFIVTSLTLSQVSSLEREAQSQHAEAIVGEWRFVNERLRSNLQTAINPETSVDAIKVTILPTIGAAFRTLEGEKGYDVIIRFASGGEFAAHGHEATLPRSGSNYNTWSSDGTARYAGAVDALPDDGLIEESPCPVTASGTCVSGVYLFVRLADGTASVEESILFPVNQP